VHIIQLLQPLVTRVNIKIVIPSLPELSPLTTPSNRQLQRLQPNIQGLNARFTHEQMNMLRHNNIANHLKLVTPADTFQRILKQVFHSRQAEVSMPLIATKSYEMKLPHVLVSSETDNHPAMLLGPRRKHRISL
jgi:hypothetical protein